jgi:segregation and condensation protein B
MTEENINQHLRILEAVLFAASEPLDIGSIADRLPEGSDVEGLIALVDQKYQDAGFNLVCHGGKYAFKTAPDLSASLLKEVTQQRRLSRAALETLAIIAYHQPVTRAEIEDIRGVAVSKGTLDVLLETDWVKIRGRRRVPGRPVTYGTTDFFLSYFDLETVRDLPGLEELRAAGLLDGRLPPGFSIPEPDPDNDPEEDALGDNEELEPLEMDLDEDIATSEGEVQAANG